MYVNGLDPSWERFELVVSTENEYAGLKLDRKMSK